jgi:hypothetical protein
LTFNLRAGTVEKSDFDVLQKLQSQERKERYEKELILIVHSPQIKSYRRKENHVMSTEPQRSYFAHIPGHVLSNRKINDACKIFYAELTTLVHKEGYCWAKNKFFVDNFGRDKRTVQRWVDTLEKEKMIVVTYDDEKTGSGRKIYTAETWATKCLNSNNSYPVTSVSPPRDKNVAHSNTKSITSPKSKETTNAGPPKKAASPVVVVSSSLEKKIKSLPGMNDKLFKKVTSEYTEEELSRAYKISTSDWVRNPIASFQTALKEKWESSKEKIDPKALVNEHFVDGEFYNKARCDITPSGIIFFRGEKNPGVSFDDPKFLPKLRAALELLGIKKNV